MIRGVAGEGDTVFSVFDGKIYSERPRWRSLTSYYWSKALWAFGLAGHTTYVLSVIENATCNAQALPWQDLSARDGSAV
jgi:hypothetical protein